MGLPVSFCKSIEQLPLITAKSIAEAAYQGDEAAIEVYQICGKYLGKALSLFIDILNPELIILGSIYGRAKSLVEQAMNDVIQQEVYNDSGAACQIVAAGLSENIGDMAALSLALMSNGV